MENTLDHVSVEQREKDRRRLLIVFTSKKKRADLVDSSLSELFAHYCSAL